MDMRWLRVMPVQLVVGGKEAWCPMANGVALSLPYHADMTMGMYLRHIVAPALELASDATTVFAKVHTPDLRVVFNGESSGRKVAERLEDGCRLVASAWPRMDPSTERSLVGNAVVDG